MAAPGQDPVRLPPSEVPRAKQASQRRRQVPTLVERQPPGQQPAPGRIQAPPLRPAKEPGACYAAPAPRRRIAPARVPAAMRTARSLAGGWLSPTTIVPTVRRPVPSAFPPRAAVILLYGYTVCRSGPRSSCGYLLHRSGASRRSRNPSYSDCAGGKSSGVAGARGAGGGGTQGRSPRYLRSVRICACAPSSQIAAAP